MFIADIRKSVPFNVSALNLNPAHINHDAQSYIIDIPLNNYDILEAVTPFAYDIASRCDWQWPDIGQTTVAFEIDYSRSFMRFALRVGVQPQVAEIETDICAEWAEFERKRCKSVQAHIRNGGKEATDTYPVLLTAQEMSAIDEVLYTHFAIF